MMRKRTIQDFIQKANRSETGIISVGPMCGRYVWLNEEFKEPSRCDFFFIFFFVIFVIYFVVLEVPLYLKLKDLMIFLFVYTRILLLLLLDVMD